MITSAQELYNKVKTHLLTQNEKSVDCEGHCAYRNERGLKCAAGILIEDYNPSYEGCQVTQLSASTFGISEDLKQMLRELQKIHDDIDVWEWANALKALAEEHGLNARL